MSKLIPVLCIPIAAFSAVAVGQQQVPVVFTIDNSISEVAIALDAAGSMDNDASPVSGTLEATLDIDTSGASPIITGIEFTGGQFTNDEDYSFQLTVLSFLNVNLLGSGFVGSPSTPAPPSIVTQDVMNPLEFQYDAADHLLSINEGIITVSGAINESLDLSQDPVSGMAPIGSFATIELTPGASMGGMTEYQALLTQPTLFSDTFNVDAGIVNLPVTVDVSGQVIATTAFALESSGGGAGPGDFDGGGLVEQADLDFVLLNWGMQLDDPAAIGWINDPPNGIVDQDELDRVLLNWGNAAPALAAGVPEPGALSLVTLAAASLFALRRRPT